MTRPSSTEAEVAATGAAKPGGARSQPAGDAQSASVGGWGLPLVVLVAGMFMSVLDTSIVNVALPTLQNDFGATTDDVQWVLTAYTLTLGVVVPATAWLGERFGLSRIYNLSLLSFAAGSALCGLAWDLKSLIAFRIIQAIPGGILPVITLTILYRIVPRERLGAAMGMYGLGVVFAPAVGPSLGGYLVEYVDWRLIFFINVPIGILGAVAATLVLPSFPGRVGHRFDVLGFLTIASGLFALLLAVSEGESWGWTSYPVLGLLTYSVLSLALFVVIELEVADPLLDIRVFRYRAFAQAQLLVAMLMVVMFGVLFYIPQFLQVAQGWGAFDSGLALLPQAIVMGIMMPIAGRLYDRFGPRWPVVVGLSVAAVGAYLLHTITIDAPREHVIWLLAVQAFGMGLSMMPIMTGGIAAIPVAQSNIASAFTNVVRNVAGSLGVAVLTAILIRQQAGQLAARSALVPATTLTPHLGPPGIPDWLGVYAVYHDTSLQVFVGAIDDLFLICSAVCVLGAVVALFLRSGRAPAAPPGMPAPTVEAAPLATPDRGPKGAVSEAGVARSGENLVDAKSDPRSRSGAGE
jgi:EmrB/QacA subfamily drug resistance transporter